MLIFWEYPRVKPVFYLQLDFSRCLELYTQWADFLLYAVIRYLKYATGQERIHRLRYLPYFHFMFSWPQRESRIS